MRRGEHRNLYSSTLRRCLVLLTLILVAAKPIAADAGVGSGKLAFARAEKDDSTEAYQKFLRKYPYSEPYSTKARDRIAWHNAASLDTPRAYRDYLKGFPNGERARSAEGSIKLYAIMDDGEISTRERLAMLRQLYEDYGQVSAMSYSLASLLEDVYFTNSELLLSFERFVDGSSLTVFDVDIVSSSTYEIFAGKVAKGELVLKCDFNTVRTMHAVTDTQLRKIADVGKKAEEVGITCKDDAEDMAGFLVGEEAFGELDRSITPKDVLVDFLPERLSPSVAFTRSFGTYSQSGGLLNDALEGATQFAIEHPIATELIVEGIKARYQKK